MDGEAARGLLGTREQGANDRPEEGYTLDAVGHGSVLAGRYRLEDRLQASPDGSVWRAVDETLERQVSVRVVRGGHPFAADVVDAARRAALVDDPRLARVLDVGETKGTTYIVTEYVQGRLLEDFLRHGPLPAETVRRIVGEAAQALDRAGARGLHHLRLSPASVCIIPDGSIKLLGTAIEAAAGGVEQDNAEAASRSDAVGLVSLVYAGLTGRWPGVVDGPLGPAPRVTGRAVPPSELVAAVPGDLDTLCTVTLSPKDDDGPRTPGELAEQLSPWAQPAPLTDPRGLEVSSPERPVVLDLDRADLADDERPQPAVPASTTGSTPTPPDGVPVPETDDQATEDRATAGRATEDPQTQPFGLPAAAFTREAEAADQQVRAPVEVRSMADSEPFPVRSAAAQPPLVHAPAFPVPGERSAGRSRVSDLERGQQAWPTPAPAMRTTVVTPPGTPLSAGTSDLASEILGDPSARGVRRLDPAPPPPLNGPAPHDSGFGGWGGGHGDDRLGPFMPPVPVARPPESQARLVLSIIGGLVVLGLLLSLFALRGVFTANPLTPRAVPSIVTGRGAAVPSVTANAPIPGVSAGDVEIAGVKAIDPMGDQTENGASAPRVIDGDSATEWRSERYDTPNFGGLGKTGLGLVIDLGQVSTVTQVVVEHRGTGGTLELRTAAEATFDGSTLLSSVPMEGNRLVITLSQPVDTRYLVLWFTKVTRQSSGENRLRVFEVSVR